MAATTELKIIIRCILMMREDNNKYTARHGQTIVFLLMALTILMFALLWNIDLHRLVVGKSHAQNAGDSAVLAAAKWQGETLNLIGELNLMHALAMSAGDTVAVDSITNAQARLCFTGPLAGLVASQVAAKNNKVYNNDEFTDLLKAHADEVRRYDNPVGGGLVFPEPFPGAWREYADMLDAIAGDGIAAGPDNATFFSDVTSGHILLDKEFYEAVAGRTWCWFYLNTAICAEPPRTLLDEFVSYETFGPVPPPDPPSYYNSEILGLGLVPRSIQLGRAGGIQNAMQNAADSQEIDLTEVNPLKALSVRENWYFYGKMWQSPWPGMNYDAGTAEKPPLPMAGKVKPEYNYTGADAVIRLYVSTYRMSSNNSEDELVWTAAAKPFGYLDTDGVGSFSRTCPHLYGLVLPAFRDVRLIPVDAATSGGDGSFDIEWRKHTDEHVPVYTECGRLGDGCRYCKLIKRFEDDAFRNEGIIWLRANHELCTLPPSGGPGHGGGTRRGH